MDDNRYLQEAINIGNQLITASERDRDGLSWKNVNLKHNGTFIWERSENIYSGICGIVLFFIELYKITTLEKYLTTAKLGMNWVDEYCKKNPTERCGMMVGRMGVSYTFLKLYEITKNKKDLQKALKIARDCTNLLKKSHRKNDYLNGRAGMLLVLLHLYQVNQEQWLFKLIEEYSNELIQHAKYRKEGLYWDINPRQIRPFSGFAHGASGIGFVFLELGYYFQNPAFLFVAEQAFTFEDSYYDKKTNNWLCFFLPIWETTAAKKYEKAYLKNNLSLFKYSENLNQWCQGAAGIGLARLRTLNESNKHRVTINRALKKTRHTHFNTYTLCHGNGGNADLFLEYYLYSHDKKYLDYAEKAANNALQQKKKFNKYFPGIKKRLPDKPEDTGLFMGIAGIGYFLLRVYSPQKVSSILVPKLTTTNKQSTKMINLPQVKKRLITNIFPRTVELMDSFSPERLEKYFSEEQPGSQLNSFINFAKEIILSLPIEEKQQLTKIYTFELFKTKLENKTNNGLIYIKERLQQKEAKLLLELTDEKFMKLNLKIIEEVSIFHINQSFVVIKATPVGIKEQTVNEFCAVVLKSFKKARQVGEVVKKVLTFYHVSEEKKETVTEKVLEQVREAITYGLIQTRCS